MTTDVTEKCKSRGRQILPGISSENKNGRLWSNETRANFENVQWKKTTMRFGASSLLRIFVSECEKRAFLFFFFCSRALPHFPFTGLSHFFFPLLPPRLYFLSFALLALLFHFSRFFSFVSCVIGAVGYRFVFRFVRRQVCVCVGLPAPPRVLQKKGRGARREESNSLVFEIGIAIEYPATDTDHDRSGKEGGKKKKKKKEKEIALARRGTDCARRQHRRGPWAGVYGVDRAATLVFAPASSGPHRRATGPR